MECFDCFLCNIKGEADGSKVKIYGQLNVNPGINKTQIKLFSVGVIENSFLMPEILSCQFIYLFPILTYC